jgi:1,4-dihydroxy-2-naphthoate octaprenyltransferase
MGEPTSAIFHRSSLANQLLTMLAATRPAFLTASILPVLCAGALVHAMGTSDFPLALLSLAIVNIALIHSGANVLNDYFDALNGSDEANQERIFPFTGGSRFIQNDVLSRNETRNLGLALLAAGALLGLFMTAISGPLLLALGLIGGALAFFYSAPPCLSCRGLGDIVIALCFGLLPVAGTVYILQGSISAQAMWLGCAIGCFTAAILWNNSIPDIKADRLAGKLTLPARMGEKAARLALPLWFAAGFAILLASPLPPCKWLALLAIMPALLAARNAALGQTASAIVNTLFTHAAFCLLLCAGLLFLC